MIKNVARAAAVCLALALGPSACSDADDGDEDYPSGSVTMSVGADPGSGLDLTMRTLVEVLDGEAIVTTPMPVENHPGDASAVWTAQMVEEHAGEDDQVSVASLVTMTNHARGESDYNVEDLTMIARLLTDYYVVVAAADSAYDDLGSAIDAVVADPGAVRVGAASDDQLPFALLVEAGGGDASAIEFVPLEGGPEQSAALAAGDISLAVSGASELLPMIESGELSGLAVLKDEPLDGLDVPTAPEQGFDVTLANWRGIYGPPDMPAYAVEYWADAVADAVETDAWREAAASNLWETTYLSGDDLDRYLEETDAEVAAAFASMGAPES